MYTNAPTYHSMDVRISKIPTNENELVDIRCHKETDCVREIAAFVKSRQGQLSAALDGRQYGIAVSDIMYIETVDNKTFIYTAKEVYESRQRIDKRQAQQLNSDLKLFQSRFSDKTE